MEEELENEVIIDEEKASALKLPEITYTESDYCRPPLHLKSNTQDIYFMQTDIDHTISRRKVGEEHEERAVIRIFGITKEGNSILVLVNNFLAYLQVECPDGFDTSPTAITNFKRNLTEKANYHKTIQNKSKNPIHSIQVCQKENIRNYKGDHGKTTFLKIAVQQPGFVSAIKGLFNGGITDQNLDFPTKVYESNLPYPLRFMVDVDMMGMSWLKLKAKNYSIRTNHLSTCQAEFETDYLNLEIMPLQGEFNNIAPLRILSFDIECCAQKGFPQAEHHPIIQIASICKSHTSETNLVKTIFTLKDCSNIADAQVKCFNDERELLLAWERLIMVTDPDIITGYNIINFDLPYIINRAQHLGLKDFGHLGRYLCNISRIKDGKYLSKAMGMRETKDINIDGRVQLDMYIHMQKDHKLSSYSLNAVSYTFLGDQKEDVHHSLIYTLQNKDNDSRKRIAVYCLKDALLPLRLISKLQCIYNYVEMARVSGVPLNYLFTRGQQIKVASMLYRKAKLYDYVVPGERSGKSDGKFEGAFVLDPVQKFYQVPIATLDFASLYPSIMMAHNLCYSTLIEPSVAMKMNPNDYVRTPHGDYFVKSHVRKGLLPMILEELLGARKKAKNELAIETDPFIQGVLNGRQLALKVSANSVYGFTGAQVGQLPCLQISSSVTAFGRQMIEKTRDSVLEIYNKQNGYKYDSEVVYGDTDSVMIKFGVETVEEAMALGKEAAGKITEYFQKPIKLEFEKVYFPYLLFNRKRYAGLLWTNPFKYDKIDTKGIESVRRDNCLLIRTMIDNTLKTVLIERNVPKSIEYIKSMISELLQNKLDLSYLVITKSINKSAATDDDDESKKKDSQYKVRQAHVELVEKMKKRDGVDNAPQIGDRIAYIMVAGTKGSKNYENAEDPNFVLDHDVPIDFNYYLEKQIKPPLIRIYELIIDNPMTLFAGDHTKILYVPKLANQTTGLARFVTVKLQCLGCRAPINKGALCGNCEHKAIEIHSQKLLELNDLQETFNSLWTQCQRNRILMMLFVVILTVPFSIREEECKKIFRVCRRLLNVLIVPGEFFYTFFDLSN